MIVWLIGMMGSGKTTVGRRCARTLGLEFADTDQMVEELSGMSIARLWETAGEEKFRRLEETAVSEMATRDNVVVSTGGGSVMSAANRRELTSSGTIIWLRAGAEALASRVSTDSRPLISAGVPVIDQVSHLLDQRESVYGDLAHHVVVVEGRSIAEVASEVVRLCNL